MILLFLTILYSKNYHFLTFEVKYIKISLFYAFIQAKNSILVNLINKFVSFKYNRLNAQLNYVMVTELRSSGIYVIRYNNYIITIAKGI